METLILPSLLLFSGLITDLKARKIYNWLIIAGAVLGLSQSFYFGGLAGVLEGMSAFGLALLLTLPLVLLGVLGAGDMKLFAVLGIMTSAGTVIQVFLYSFIWAAIFGFMYALVSGRLKSVFLNLSQLAKGKEIAKQNLNQIPFTLPILLAWATHIISLRGGF
jgi:prepilin peptidase CpaA